MRVLPQVKKMYKLTLTGLKKYSAYIAECSAKRKEILDAEKDAADCTKFPTIEDVEADIAEFIDAEGDYYNCWGVTDNYSSDCALCLEIGTDFVEENLPAKEDLMTCISEIRKNDSEILNMFIKDAYVGYTVEDDIGTYDRVYYPKGNDLSKRILIDEKAAALFDMSKLAKFLSTRLDPNAITAIENIAIIYENSSAESKVRNILESKFNDEYAREACEDDLGLTWCDRQVIIINAGAIAEDALELSEEPGETHSATDIFVEGLLQTIFHEARHLVYECNELLEVGEGTAYPIGGEAEEAVEEYGNVMAANYLKEFKQCIDEQKVAEFIESMNKKAKNKKIEEIEAMEVRVPGGVLRATKSTDPYYPGIDVEFIASAEGGGSGKFLSRPRVLIEYPIEERELRALIWTDKSSEDYSDDIEFDQHYWE